MKRTYFETIRIIACAMVIFNHCPGFTAYTITSGIEQFIYTSISVLTRISVPLFFMVSGALLFPKEDDIVTVLKKRFLRVVALILFFDIILTIIDKYICFVSGEVSDITVKNFVFKVLSDKGIPGASVYWYLYAYMGVLIVLPFMHRIAMGFTRSEFITLIVLRFIATTFMPAINFCLKALDVDKSLIFAEKFSVPFVFIDAFFYTLVGYYLEHRVDVTKIKPIYIRLLCLALFIGICFTNIYAYIGARINGSYSTGDLSLLGYFIACAVFILIKYMFVIKLANVSMPHIDSMIIFMGSMTLGIYMMDFGLRRLLFDWYIAHFNIEIPIIVMMASFGWILFSMVICSACTCVLKRIPGIKKLL